MSLLSLQKKITGIGKRVYFQPQDYDRLARAFGVSPEEVAKLAPQMPGASPVLDLDEVRKNSTGDGRTFTFVASDGSVDRSGDTIDPHGWDLAGWKKTGSPILYGHDASSLPIGKGIGAHVDSGRLIVKIRFAPTSMGQRVEQLIAGDHGLRSVSVGFVPKTWSMSKDKDRLHGIDYHTQRLLELSVVPVPANENAVLQRSLDTQEDRRALADEIQAGQRRLDAKVEASARHKRERVETATRFRAEAKAEQAWQAHLRNTTPEERRRKRYADLARVIGKDEAAIREQAARDRRS